MNFNINHFRTLIENALSEDIGSGDLTAQLIPIEQISQGRIICRDQAVICGLPFVNEIFRQVDESLQISWQIEEGATVEPNQILCTFEGKARSLLTAERTALNFLQTLSATATATKKYVEIITGTQSLILDTRKTLPCLRLAQKYAVQVGGGTNQRIGLFDGILIKENHIAAAGSITAVLQQAQTLAPAGVSIQIEVENLDELNEALLAGANLILLDNFSLEMMREAVNFTQNRAKLEASGGVNLETVRAIAETGVDRISIGSLTKDIKAVDLSMRLI